MQILGLYMAVHEDMIPKFIAPSTGEDLICLQSNSNLTYAGFIFNLADMQYLLIENDAESPLTEAVSK